MMFAGKQNPAPLNQNQPQPRPQMGGNPNQRMAMALANYRGGPDRPMGAPQVQSAGPMPAFPGSPNSRPQGMASAPPMPAYPGSPNSGPVGPVSSGPYPAYPGSPNSGVPAVGSHIMNGVVTPQTTFAAPVQPQQPLRPQFMQVPPPMRR